jgi:Na+/melibiose symporter-like transporter
MFAHDARFLAGNPKGPSNVYAVSNSPVRRLKGDFRMLVSALVTFLVVILVLYLINLLPIDGRAKQIARVVVIILGVISLLKYIAVF